MYICNLLKQLCQGHMLERLQNALLLAIHSSRIEVQEHDWVLLPSQDAQSACNVSESYHAKDGFSFECSCYLPSHSGIVWRWPENDCLDLFPAGAGRTIVRHLAYKAGITEITSGALKLAEIELLHILAVLLVEAYESSVDMAKTARYLEEGEPLTYGISPDTIDMFYCPPPPLYALTKDEDSSLDDVEETVFTIVPGQISAAAERRNIQPSKVYGWKGFAGYFSLEESEEDKERSYYYKDCLEPDHDVSPDHDCLKSDAVPYAVVSSSSSVGAKVTHSAVDYTNRRRSGTLLDYYSKK